MSKLQDWSSPNQIALVAAWTREGKSFDDVAHLIGVSPATLSRWKAASPDLQAALLQSPQQADSQVENALLQKALGYQCVEKKVEISPKGERKEVHITKHVPPDLSAISLWLQKRRPDRWGDPSSDPLPVPNNLIQILQQSQNPSPNCRDIPELQPSSAPYPFLVEP